MWDCTLHVGGTNSQPQAGAAQAAAGQFMYMPCSHRQCVSRPLHPQVVAAFKILTSDPQVGSACCMLLPPLPLPLPRCPAVVAASATNMRQSPGMWLWRCADQPLAPLPMPVYPFMRR